MTGNLETKLILSISTELCHKNIMLGLQNGPSNWSLPKIQVDIFRISGKQKFTLKKNKDFVFFIQIA